jgi:ankyrin repeat protein
MTSKMAKTHQKNISLGEGDNNTRGDNTAKGVLNKVMASQRTSPYMQLLAAISACQRDLIKTILEETPNLIPLIEKKSKVSEIGPLHLATCAADLHCLQVLLDYKIDVNLQNVHKETPLHLAASKNWPSKCQYLVENGADLHAKNDVGNTPLHKAAHQRNTECVRRLLHLGANPQATNTNGNNPLHVLATTCATESLAVPGTADHLILELEATHTRTIDTLKALLSAGCSPTQKNTAGVTPIYTIEAGINALGDLPSHHPKQKLLRDIHTTLKRHAIKKIIAIAKNVGTTNPNPKFGVAGDHKNKITPTESLSL